MRVNISVRLRATVSTRLRSTARLRSSADRLRISSIRLRSGVPRLRTSRLRAVLTASMNNNNTLLIKDGMIKGKRNTYFHNFIFFHIQSIQFPLFKESA